MNNSTTFKQIAVKELIMDTSSITLTAIANSEHNKVVKELERVLFSPSKNAYSPNEANSRLTPHLITMGDRGEVTISYNTKSTAKRLELMRSAALLNSPIVTFIISGVWMDRRAESTEFNMKYLGSFTISAYSHSSVEDDCFILKFTVIDTDFLKVTWESDV